MTLTELLEAVATAAGCKEVNVSVTAYRTEPNEEIWFRYDANKWVNNVCEDATGGAIPIRSAEALIAAVAAAATPKAPTLTDADTVVLA